MPFPQRSSCVVSIMVRLTNSIRRLELHAEQLIIHIRSMRRDEPASEQMRSMLLVILLRLVALKAQRERLEDELALDSVA